MSNKVEKCKIVLLPNNTFAVAIRSPKKINIDKSKFKLLPKDLFEDKDEITFTMKHK